MITSIFRMQTLNLSSTSPDITCEFLTLRLKDLNRMLIGYESRNHFFPLDDCGRKRCDLVCLLAYVQIRFNRTLPIYLPTTLDGQLIPVKRTIYKQGVRSFFYRKERMDPVAW
jgi:hypothetical protein